MPAPLDAGQDFGAAFRAQRRAAGFTQAALAQRAGCRRQTIVAIEDASGLDLEGVTIATYGEAKRQILREIEFDRVRAILDPFFLKIMAME